MQQNESRQSWGSLHLSDLLDHSCVDYFGINPLQPNMPLAWQNDISV